MWVVMAIFSAVFAGVTSILVKCGVKKVDSDVATALRTGVVLIFSWLMVFLVGSFHTIDQISSKSLAFLILSGLATGGSWLCYFKALSLGDVNKVVPVDKSSTIMSVLLAIFLLGETKNVGIKLICTVILGFGIFLMIEKNFDDNKKTNRVWFPYAIASAIFAAFTSILAKIGIDNVESNLGTAIRTGVVLIMAWMIVFVKNKQSKLLEIEKKEMLFICFSGVATGCSWLCFYYAIQQGKVSVVVPIDKLSVLISVLFSRIVFKEKLSKKAILGLGLMTAATIVMAMYT